MTAENFWAIFDTDLELDTESTYTIPNRDKVEGPFADYLNDYEDNLYTEENFLDKLDNRYL